MNRNEAVLALEEGIQQILTMSRSREEGDAFRRWRVRTSMALRVLLGEDAPEAAAFYHLVYWPQNADAADEEHEQAWEQGRDKARALLVNALGKFSE